jgi:class 3 adenylate cyclase
MLDEKPHILYVDDEENNLVALKAVFRRYYNIHTVTSVRDGMQYLKTYPIQLIITDQRMPEMTGVQFLEAISSDFPDAISMVLTGFSDVDAIIKAINTGRVYRYVTKPWDEQELKMTIDGALRLFHEQERHRELIVDLTARKAEQDRILKLFQKYVPEHVVRDVVNQREDEDIFTGESRIVSILFSDIRNFTALSSRMEPDVLVKYLNGYFTVMTKVVQKHKGTVNKFLGDGLLALFGAPMSYIENQDNAVRCALEMVQVLEGFNEKQREVNGPHIEIGIGINTGEVIVGNMGSEDRLEYTAIGDAVNMTQWLESLTKSHPNSIVISESTYNIVKNMIEAEAWPDQVMEGHETGVTVYRVLNKLDE